VILIVKSRPGLSRCLALVALAGSLGMLAGCGQQGPLYLPDAKMPHGKAATKAKRKTPALPPPAPGAPASQPAATTTPSPAADDSSKIVPVVPSIPY